MIELDEQIVLANKQKITCVGFKMTRLNVTNPKKKWTAQVIFEIRDENNKFINTKITQISEDSWDEFWTNFNNGTFLYKLISSTAEGQEYDFVNEVE